MLERVQSHFRELVTPIMGFRKSMLEFTAEDLKILKRNSFTSHDLRVEVNKGPLIVQYEHRSFEVVFRPRLKRLEPDVSTALRSQNDEHYVCLESPALKTLVIWLQLGDCCALSPLPRLAEFVGKILQGEVLFCRSSRCHRPG